MTNKSNERDELINRLRNLSEETYQQLVKDGTLTYDDDDLIPVLQEELDKFQSKDISNNPIPKYCLIESKQMEEVDYNTPPVLSHRSKSHSRKGIGMDGKIMDAILNLRQDFKRVAAAMTYDGAKRLIADHNRTVSAENRWPEPVYEDVNNDGLKDIIINDANNRPVYVNGWTTKASDYPLRARYYQSNYPKQNKSIKQYREDLFKRVPKFFDSAAENGYYGVRPPISDEKRVEHKESRESSAYYKFRKSVFDPFVERVIIPVLTTPDQNGATPVPTFTNKEGQRKIVNQMAVLATACGMVWNTFILDPLRKAWNPNDEKQFNKMKNSKAGKEKVKAIVDAFIQWLDTPENGENPNNPRAHNDEFSQHIANAIVQVVGRPKEIGESLNNLLGQPSNNYLKQFNQHITIPNYAADQNYDYNDDHVWERPDQIQLAEA